VDSPAITLAMFRLIFRRLYRNSDISWKGCNELGAGEIGDLHIFYCTLNLQVKAEPETRRIRSLCESKDMCQLDANRRRPPIGVDPSLAVMADVLSYFSYAFKRLSEGSNKKIGCASASISS